MEDIKLKGASNTVWIGVKDSDGKIDGLTPFSELIPTPLLYSGETKQGWVEDDVEQSKNESSSFSMSRTIEMSKKQDITEYLGAVGLDSSFFVIVQKCFEEIEKRQFSRKKRKRCQHRRKTIKWKRKHRK